MICHVFIRSSVVRYLICYHILVIVNNAAVDIGVHVSFQNSVFIFFFFFRYVQRSGVAGSNVVLFLVFHLGCTNLHSHKQCVRIPLSAQPHQRYLCSFCVLVNDEPVKECEDACISALLHPWPLMDMTINMSKCHDSLHHFLLCLCIYTCIHVSMHPHTCKGTKC